jgi:uracil-DNA glycosylase family 4
VDARDALRRYLEQRRELGESELVLDSLSVEDALALLGASRGTMPARARQAGDVREPLRTQDASATAAQDTSAPTADWRAAIRAAGGGPERPASRTESTADDPMPKRAAQTQASPPSATPSSAAAATHVPTTQTSADAADSPLEDVPIGLVVGGASRALYDDPAAKLSTLSEIAQTVAECRRCPLYATAKNPVPGVGDPNADFMIVGEAPGANEDEQGEPFVGQAGQLLNKIIGAIDLRREDVFIANVLKHRPPGNRNPMPEEVTACSPYLVRQIELIQPKVILALGTFAAQTLLETKLTIGKLRSQIHRYYGVPLIVTYHPAALLRNPAWKRPTWEDVQLARRILDRARPSGA